jgi:hypothetical protein
LDLREAGDEPVHFRHDHARIAAAQKRRQMTERVRVCGNVVVAAHRERQRQDRFTVVPRRGTQRD